jgi:uncharacterized membrane protein
VRPAAHGLAAGRPAAARRSPAALATLLVGMGILHFAVPGTFERLVPPFLGRARLLVLVSGAAEVVFGAALLPARTRRAGAWGAAATLVAVFPGNVQMAVSAGAPRDLLSAALWLRLPLQAPLVAWAFRYTEAGTGPTPAG